MATHKVTFFFDGIQCGWTESHWFGAGGGTHEQTYAEALKLAQKRAELLGVECTLKAIRVSTEGTGPDAMLRYVYLKSNFKPVGSGTLVTAEKSAQRDVALQLRMENGTHTQHKLTFLRGIWDSIEDENGQYEPSAGWSARLSAFTKLLVEKQWGWYGSVGRTKKPLATVSAAGTTDYPVFISDGDLFVGVAPKSKVKVRISGVNGGHSNLNNVHVVQVSSVDHCFTVFPLAVPKNVIGGFISFNAYDFSKYASADDQKIISRECGAPLLESRGRQPKRARG